jgi:hypothetical protein
MSLEKKERVSVAHLNSARFIKGPLLPGLLSVSRCLS